ncbi:MAG: 2-octaprenyl-3-methyl-6-methoxy-1,4-benzoquinol hydroxylase [Rubrivivax sp.]|nr:MAG: 2-octaprenyl-3-methyl-6-methoxy-1,4-benzoquinol hydroxylase [Rubrivivax sp.]
MKPFDFDICVSGNGAVARVLALLLSGQGWRVAWAGQAETAAPAGPDVRAYALNARSVALLTRLRIWSQLQRFASPVHEMHVQGDDGGTLSFSAWQQRVTELAWIVDAAELERLLGEALRFAHHVTLLPADALQGGAQAVSAALLAVCEGKASATRDTLGVAFTREDYGHRAIAARLTASRPHVGVARQWFRSPDVLALLPFNAPEPASSYALVWSMPDAQAQALLALPAEAFEAALMQALSQSDAQVRANVGELKLASPLASWPLAMARADRWSGPGWVLLGDAAHQVHPLAGQGLNLGLADAEALATILAEARRAEPWRSPGDERLLRRYARERWWPTQAMAGVTDGLLKLFAHDQSPLRELRNRGMGLLDQLPPVKRWLSSRALDN